MASLNIYKCWTRQQTSLCRLLLQTTGSPCITSRSQFISRPLAWQEWSVVSLKQGRLNFWKSYGTRPRQITQIPAQQGLFHIDLPPGEFGNKLSKSEGPQSSKKKVLGDSGVQYAYHKEMLSASTYLQKEREKLASQPKTEMEVFHPKHTPRLFYFEREEYKDTACCLPRRIIAEGDGTCQENFLDRISMDKNSFFPMSFVMSGIESLCERSDEWLIDLNNDTRFLRLCVILRATCIKMSNDELADVLKFLARTQVRTRNSVLPALYEECCSRVGTLSLQLNLLFLDCWRMIGFPVPQLTDKVFKDCQKSIPTMTTPELVQLIYLIGENRSAPDGLEKELVKVLPDHINSMKLTELGVVCTGLFKSRTSPQMSDLMMQISDHVCSSDIQSVHSFFVVGILKHFRRQYSGYQHFFQYVANAVTPVLKFYPLTSCMQILLTYATMHICHPQLCDRIADEITKKVDEWRSKDATKILWSYGTLQYLPDREDFLPIVMDQLIRSLQGDLDEYPINLVTSLLSLAYLQLYPRELIHKLYSKRFLHSISEYMDQTGFDLRRDMILLDRALEIECPEYDGNRLDESFMLTTDINSSIVPSIGQQLTTRPEVRFIAGLVRAAVGRREHYKIHSILPHFNTLDIEVRLNVHNQPILFNERSQANRDPETNSELGSFSNSRKNGTNKGKNAVALSSDLISNLTGGSGADSAPAVPGSGDKGDPEGGILIPAGERGEGRRERLWNVKRILQKPLRAPANSREKRLAIVVWARNHSHYGGSKLLGQHAMKRRQLELLGYHVVDVPFQDWTRLMKSSDQQDNIRYMRRKIFNGLSSSPTQR